MGLFLVQPGECNPVCNNPHNAVLMFRHQRAGFTLAQLLSMRRDASVSAEEKGPCPCGHLLFLVPSVHIHHQRFQACSYNYSCFSVVMLYFLNQLYPPVLSSLTLTLHLALLTLRSSNCNFSISGRPHRKCIHPNNHMFSSTKVAINVV